MFPKYNICSHNVLIYYVATRKICCSHNILSCSFNILFCSLKKDILFTRYIILSLQHILFPQHIHFVQYTYNYFSPQTYTDNIASYGGWLRPCEIFFKNILLPQYNILFPQLIILFPQHYFVPSIYYFVPTTDYLVPSIYYYQY